MVPIIVLVVIVAVKALVCAGAVSDMFIKVVTVVGMTADVLIIVSKVAVDLLMGALNDIMLGVLSNIDVNVLVDMFAGVMTPFDFDMPVSLEEFRC